MTTLEAFTIAAAALSEKRRKLEIEANSGELNYKETGRNDKEADELYQAELELMMMAKKEWDIEELITYNEKMGEDDEDWYLWSA